MNDVSPYGMKFEERELSLLCPVVFHEHRFDEDSNIRMHYHSSLEINICNNSEGEILVEGVAIPLEKYTLYVIQPGTLHSYRIRGSGRKIKVWHIGLRYFSYLNFQNLEEQLNERFPPILCRQLIDSRIPGLLEDLKRCEGSLYSHSNLLFLLDILFSESRESPDIKPRDEFLHRVKDYSEKHFHTTLSLDDAAANVNFSRYHFCRKFKEKTGSTYGEYINNLRMEHSLECLYRGQSVSEAASLSGFEDTSYFIKCFKRQFGLTPGNYRSKNTSL